MMLHKNQFNFLARAALVVLTEFSNATYMENIKQVLFNKVLVLFGKNLFKSQANDSNYLDSNSYFDAVRPELNWCANLINIQ